MPNGQQFMDGVFRSLISKRKLWLYSILAFFLVCLTQVSSLKIDASADSLLLEGDPDLAFFREVNKNYGASDFILVTFTPKGDVFSEENLQTITNLRDDFLDISRVDNVQSVLDVPLVLSPKMEISELSQGIKTIAKGNVDLTMAKEELSTSPLYEDLLLSRDKKSTALQIVFERDDYYFTLLERRNQLSSKKRNEGLSLKERITYEKTMREFDFYNGFVAERDAAQTEQVRQIISRYDVYGDFAIGGATMISSDIVTFIKDDLRIFGFAILLFIIVALYLFFDELKWVLIPLACCLINVVLVTGALTFLNWKISIISSNYISLLLILTMSICIHLIVKYRELLTNNPEQAQEELVLETLNSMLMPCFYTTLTTIVAFMSLVFSGILPVESFGWIMTVGVSLALILSFIVLPCLLISFEKKPLAANTLLTEKITKGIGQLSLNAPKATLTTFIALTALAVFGITQLTVENRFIDYFKTETEIFKGMLEIDTKFGGTTSFDIIINAPQSHFEVEEFDDEEFDDDFGDFDAHSEDGGGDPMEESYWYNPKGLDLLEEIHDFVDEQPQTGKVISLATIYKLAKELKNGGQFSQFELLYIYNSLPYDLRRELLQPYISEDANQVRISTRIIDSNKEMNRNEFINGLREKLNAEFEFEEKQFRFSGLLVLYNNLLQSLFSSQIKTLGFVFFAIFLTFLFIFKDFKLALIAIFPNMISATLILGFIGLIKLPLDFMTITVASITIGIAVDDTIHYLHRFRKEFANKADYARATLISHQSTGKAMYYTSVTIIAGFSILVFSNFNPSLYFGLLTGLAMFIALACNLLLLPVLINRFSALGSAAKA